MTAVTAVGSGTGNLVSNLDAGLGSRLDEIMHRMIICTDGSDFDSSHPNAVSTGRKRAAGTLGQAICAAEGAATMSQPGGSLNDLLLINSVSFTFNAGDVANAAQVVIDFVRDYSSMLAIDADTATQLGTILFALAIDTIVEGTVLGAHNTIAGSLISTGTITTGPSTTDTATSCSTHSACVATCDGIGAYFYYCETTCVQASGCATSGQSESVTTTATNPWAVTTVPLADYTTDNSAPTSTADPVCSPSASSGKIPALMAMELGVEFCTTKGVDFTKDARLTLGGGDFTPTMEIGSDLNLSYTFADGPCDNDCSDTVLNIVQKCAQTVDGKTWFNGQAMSQTPCGNYTIEAIPLPDPTSTTAPTSASSTATYRPESQVTCTDPTQYKPFTVANADVATSVFCKDTIDITNVLQTWNVITTGGDLIVFWLGFANDQSGCYAPVSRDNNLSPDSCTKWFRSAYNNCDLDTTDAKHGSRPLVWNSPNGCIEFWIYGGLTSYPG